MSQVVNTIRNQLQGMGVNLRDKMLVKVDDNTLRVTKLSRRIGGYTKSVDIKYDEGSDLYNVSIHELKGIGKMRTCRTKGVFFDSLPQYFEKSATKMMKCERWK